jgi:hypothetical protein
MKRWSRIVKQSRFRSWSTATAGCVVLIGLSAGIALGCTPLYAGITPSVAQGSHVGSSSYDITLDETTSSPCNTGDATLYSGTSSTGHWTWKGGYTFSHGSTYAQHKWSVVNQSNGSYWWYGELTDTGGTLRGTTACGPFYTP